MQIHLQIQAQKQNCFFKLSHVSQVIRHRIQKSNAQWPRNLKKLPEDITKIPRSQVWDTRPATWKDSGAEE